MTLTDAEKNVVFVENAIPPLRDGMYTLNAKHEVPGQDPGTATAAASFVVTGERFTIAPTEIDAVFPPELANGEFDGVLPHVVLTRLTLPWEREIDTPGSTHSYPKSPWLAVLLCDGADAPKPAPATAKDLVAKGTTITVTGSGVTGVGAMPTGMLSYGTDVLVPMNYGETPDDKCNVVDLPVATFDAIAPAAADLVFLAHIRETDTSDGSDSDTTSARTAVVVGNRVAPANGVARAYLVSLEGLADYLPGADGSRSSLIGDDVKTVRLLCYRSWEFTTNDMDQTLERLLACLDTPPPDGKRSTVLTLPITGDAPQPEDLKRAMAAQETASRGGTPLDPADAAVLVRNALLLGYVPMDHHLRHGGHTVSWYRGPLAPVAVPSTGTAYYSGPDAANAYNPQTGLFDVSYGAAWELGRLLALQSKGMANALYQWKQTTTQYEAQLKEQELLAERLGHQDIFPSYLGRRARRLQAGPPPLPPVVLTWFSNLAKLDGVPFNYLVPDERMLPPESIRFFYLDPNWMDALIDGAFSIGRASARPGALEELHAPRIRALARGHRHDLPRNRLAAIAPAADGSAVTGFVMRSQAIAGWPNLRVLGFANGDRRTAIPPRTIVPLSRDTLLCLFPDVLTSILLREPPEKLHMGVEGKTAGDFHTILRSVVGGPGDVRAGEQYKENLAPHVSPCDPTGTEPWACIPTRAGSTTLDIAAAAAAIQSRLVNDFSQQLPRGVTAAEFALEMTKGVVEVEYAR